MSCDGPDFALLQFSMGSKDERDRITPESQIAPPSTFAKRAADGIIPSHDHIAGF